MVFVSPLIDISAVTVILVIISKIIQAKFIDKKQMKEQQAQMKKKQKKMRELQGKNDNKSLEELKLLEQEILEETSKMMKGSMNYMMFSLPIFLLVFWWLGGTYGEAIIQLPIALPWFAEFNWFNPLSWFNIKFYTETGWFGWYFVSYLSASIIIGIFNKVKETVLGEKK